VAENTTQDYSVHIESFGGCMLGQMCPPSLLLAINILEGVFFQTYGVKSLSLSYTQQTSFSQDVEALHALRRLGAEFLNTGIDWHIVLYAYMGVFPETAIGCHELQKSAINLAKAGNVERVIVKTVAEASRIPTFSENIDALEFSQKIWDSMPGPFENAASDVIYEEAKAIILNTLNIDANIDKALSKAFSLGIMDVPYCLHKDNKGDTKSYIDNNGYIKWANSGSMLTSKIESNKKINPYDFLKMLSYTKHKFDKTYS
jgi:methylaspartate mutase epsilon subunit